MGFATTVTVPSVCYVGRQFQWIDPLYGGPNLAQPLALDEISRLIDALLAKDYPTIDAVARLLRLSPRTFQRLLHQQGISYSELVDRCRCQAAWVARLRRYVTAYWHSTTTAPTTCAARTCASMTAAPTRWRFRTPITARFRTARNSSSARCARRPCRYWRNSRTSRCPYWR